MKEFYKKLIFYYFDSSGKKRQKTKNIILLNPYTNSDLIKEITTCKDQIKKELGLLDNQFYYCHIVLDKWDRHYYVSSVNYYFNDKKHDYKYL